MIFVLVGTQRDLNQQRRANAKFISKALVEMRPSDMMALQARFCMGHIRWILLSLRQRLGSTAWESIAPDALYRMEK
jgi:hypothetical protein